MYPVEGPGEASDNPAEYRETIHVMTMDLDRTVLALPHLLRQLDIPVDAVGWSLKATGRLAIP